MRKDENALMKPVSLEQLLREEMTQVDLYVQLSQKKYVMVAKAGTKTESLSRYRDRQVQYLHVRYEDLTKLVQNSMSVAGMVLNKDNIADSSKIVVLEQALSNVYRSIENFGFNGETTAHAKVVSEATMTMCLTHSELQKLVLQMSQLENPMHRHSIMTSALCSMLGVAMGYTVPSTLEKLALGGFLLDIGTIKLPQDIIQKSVEKMSKAETDIYRSHVELGVSMSQVIREIPSDVTLMIHEHHELADGTGYPRRIKDLMMSPLGRIAVVANAFVEEIMHYGTEAKPQDVNAVVERMNTHTAHRYNKEVLKALRVILYDYKTHEQAS